MQAATARAFCQTCPVPVGNRDGLLLALSPDSHPLRAPAREHKLCRLLLLEELVTGQASYSRESRLVTWQKLWHARACRAGVLGP